MAVRRTLPRHLFRFQFLFFLILPYLCLFVLSTSPSSQSIGIGRRNLLQTNTPPASNIRTPFFPSNSIPAFSNNPSSPPPPPPSPLPPLSFPPNRTVGDGGGGKENNNSRSNSVTGAVLGTFFGTIVFSSLAFFAFYRYDTKRRQRQFHDLTEEEERRRKKNSYSYNHDNNNGSRKNNGGGEVKQNMIVDDNGLDVLYWKKLEEGEGGGGGLVLCSYCRQELHLNNDDEDNDDEEGRRGRGRSNGRRRHRNQETPLIAVGSVRSDDLDPPRFGIGSNASSYVSSSIQSQHETCSHPSGSLFPPPAPTRLFPTHTPSPPLTVTFSVSAAVTGTSPPPPEVVRTSPSPPPIPSGTAISFNVATTVTTPPPPPTVALPPPPLPVKPGATAAPQPPPLPVKPGATAAPQPPPLPVKPGATAAPQPPPLPVKPGATAAPQPPPLPVKPGATAAPQPPSLPVKAGATPPPPPGRQGAIPPQPPRLSSGPNKTPPVPPLPGAKPPSAPKLSTGSEGGPTKRAQLPPPAKLRPLHWDKMTTANVQHSMVWDKIPDGSFRFDDDDIMVTLFGTAATNRNSAEPAHARTGSGGSSNTNSSQQIVLLDPRKSQNIAIVLRSLAIGRQTILDALLDGHGLAGDTLEKLANAPRLTKDEETLILGFSEDPSKLADTESFFYHLLRSVPFPFDRLDVMLFRTTFDHDVTQIKESLLVLETACKEMKNSAVFPKLLAAILKAGNRMNAGTSKGNAQAFNLTSLRKLSDVKSTDGKTTLLHFLVEEVVRSEGKRCVLNKTGSSITTTTLPSPTTSREEKEREYMTLGLPVVGGLSIEFANVKKAAVIDHDTLMSSFSTLEAKLKKSRTSVLNAGEVGDFGKEMGEFLDSTEEELKKVGEEKLRVMELVARTAEYYVVGASKDRNFSPLQLFAIVKDFLTMVDQVCVDVTRNIQQQQLQKKRIEQQKQQQQQQQQQQQVDTAAAGVSDVISDRSPAGSGRLSSPTASGRMSPVRFTNFPQHFLRKNSSDSGSDSDGDFDD